MKAVVLRLDYENRAIGEVVDKFCSAGLLKISAIEQVKFLVCLDCRGLPLAESDQAIVRESIELEKEAGWTLYNKTGWASPQTSNIGWWG